MHVTWIKNTYCLFTYNTVTETIQSWLKKFNASLMPGTKHKVLLNNNKQY